VATLAVAEIVKLVALNWESVTAGSVGYLITSLPPISLFGSTVNWEGKVPFYAAAAILTVIALSATGWLQSSRLGAFLAGMGGGFYAFYFRYVDPDAVAGIGLSMEMVFIAVVGGLGTVGGPLIGAVFLTVVAELVRERFQAGHLIFYGLFMMLVIRFMPEGIWGRVRRMASGKKTGG
jgi:branched-chain amino acid transport system permease protein